MSKYTSNISKSILWLKGNYELLFKEIKELAIKNHFPFEQIKITSKSNDFENSKELLKLYDIWNPRTGKLNTIEDLADKIELNDLILNGFYISFQAEKNSKSVEPILTIGFDENNVFIFSWKDIGKTFMRELLSYNQQVDSINGLLENYLDKWFKSKKEPSTLTLSKINAKQNDYNLLRPLKSKDEDRLWEKFRLEWNYNSNHIEGNTLTYTDTKLLLIFDKTTGDHKFKEYEEMKAHDAAIELVKLWASDSKSQRPLSQAEIRELNKIILVEPYWSPSKTLDGKPSKKKIIPGNYKSTPNHVELPNGKIFRYAEPEEVPIKMQGLIDWYRNETDELHPIIVAAQLHYKFVRIHPFDDGNGRVSRLLMNYHLIKNNFPPIIIKSNDKTNYLNALNKADSGNLQAFEEYIAKQLFWSFEKVLEAGKGKDLEEVDDWKKQIFVLKKSVEGDEKVKEKSNELIHKRYHDSFKILFDFFEKELEVIDGLFAGTNHNRDFSIVNMSGIDREKYSSLDEIIEYLFKEDALLNLTKIECKLWWDGFKANPKKPLSKSIYLEINFQNRYKYSVQFSNGPDLNIERLYTQLLEKEEIQNISNLAGNFVYQTISNWIK